MSEDPTTLAVAGMDRTGCGRKIEKAPREIAGVRDVSRHYPDTVLGVLPEPSVSEATIRERVEGIGYRTDAAPAF